MWQHDPIELKNLPPPHEIFRPSPGACPLPQRVFPDTHAHLPLCSLFESESSHRCGHTRISSPKGSGLSSMHPLCLNVFSPAFPSPRFGVASRRSSTLNQMSSAQGIMPHPLPRGAASILKTPHTAFRDGSPYAIFFLQPRRNHTFDNSQKGPARLGFALTNTF